MEFENKTVKPIAEASSEISFYLHKFKKARAQTLSLIKDLTPEELAWRVLPNMNSIGANILHLGECEYWYLQSIAAEKEMTEEGKKLSHYLDTVESDFDKGWTAEYCFETLEKITDLSEKFLATKTDADLDKIHPRDDLDRPVELSLRGILRILIDNEAYYSEQISKIKHLLCDSKNNIDSIS